MVQDYDGRWRFSGSCGSLSGAELYEIFKAFVEAETLTDWEKASIDHGDDATVEHLARTDAQRRFDAWMAISQAAANARAAAPGGSQIVTNIVITEESLAKQLRFFAGTGNGTQPRRRRRGPGSRTGAHACAAPPSTGATSTPPKRWRRRCWATCAG